ncbi:MAG: hypothetical protein O7F08_14105, partial [Deltaproteobacteria bacterium]|nr:hypothetical protein [Deltaproteobacteria bacterium]
SCQDDGFENGLRCSSGRCVCDDPFEYNDTFENFALICGGSTGLNCMQEAWGIELQATLHQETDIDYYALEVLDADTVLIADLFEGGGRYTVHMTYFCPNGELGIKNCSGSSDDLEGITFCVADVREPGDFVGLARFCEPSSASEIGTVLVGVRAKVFPGGCDPYGLRILATYGAAETF